MEHKITPFLWFNGNAREALDFYRTIFPSFKLIFEQKMPDGTIFSAEMELEGARIKILNVDGGEFQFNEAISLFISCEDQNEIDYYWNKLTEGGSEQPCGWLKDRFGLSWQVAPKDLGKYLFHQDPTINQELISTFRKMKKIDTHKLKAIING